MNPSTQLQAGKHELDHIWKVTALRGATAIVFGAVILIWPDIGLATLIALFGAFALVSGLTTIAGAFDVPGRGGERAWLVVEGLLGLAAGIAVLVWPGLSAVALLYAIAAWAMAVGMLQTTLAFVLRAGGRSLLLALAGLVSIAFGVVMFGHPGAGALALLALISAFALVGGVMQLAVAFELRGNLAELEQKARRRVTARTAAQG
jgi:uncharacterized membrane protein HdeD (DUF308 family)